MDLNEKLARWLGYKKRKDGYYKRISPRVWECKSFAEFNFDSSLDACFEWLVPKLKSDVLLSHSPDCSEWHCDIIASKMYIGEEPTPALALCKAIEKMIDEEKRK